MADQIDEAQGISDRHLDAALRNHADRSQPVGRRMCANLDCGDPISDYCRLHGAQLCLAGQGDEENRAKQLSTWSRF